MGPLRELYVPQRGNFVRDASEVDFDPDEVRGTVRLRRPPVRNETPMRAGASQPSDSASSLT